MRRPTSGSDRESSGGQDRTSPPRARSARRLSTLGLYLVSVAIGGVAALGAVVFRGLIALFHNLLFLGVLSPVYDANVHTPESPWGAWIVTVPPVAALGVAFLVKNFAPEAKGHGVPEVVEAIYYNRGVIRPVVALVKATASALSIGSGGAVGREGPIIQIGSAFGSTLGQVFGVPMWQRMTMLAAGAAGGIAATFNAPVGGVLFAVEIMMLEVSARTLVPVAISTATATWVGRLFFGAHPSFVIPTFETSQFALTSPFTLVAFVGLGVAMGLVSVVYIRSIYRFEDAFDAMPGSYYLRHAGGMLVVGIVFYGLLRFTGHYYVEGVGYATVQDVLTGTLDAVPLLLLLCVLKLLTTSLTLGSGASGGVFSPGLYMGATFGAAYAIVANAAFPELALSPPAFAVAGMAGVVGGSTGAAMAAIVMIFEMTLDYNVIVPMTVTVALSYGVRSRLCPQSIYSLKLFRRGRAAPESLRTNAHELRRADELMETTGVRVDASQTVDALVRALADRADAAWFLVTDADRLVGVLTRSEALGARSEGRDDLPIGEIARRDWLVVGPGASLSEVVSGMRERGASCALVVEGEAPPTPDAVRGLITKVEIADALAQASELYTG